MRHHLLVTTAVNLGLTAVRGIADKAFLTAYLLTGDSRTAEKATLAGIESWNLSEEPADAVFKRTLAAALDTPAPNEPEGELPAFPAELQRVLRLPPRLRHCFVLRVLLELPLDVCARMLHLTSRRVNQSSLAAGRALACRRVVGLKPGAD